MVSPEFSRGARAMQDAVLITLNTLDTEDLSPNDVRRQIYKAVFGLDVADASVCAHGAADPYDDLLPNPGI